MSLEILYEDNHLLAVHKPAGILVHGDKTRDVSLLDLAKSYIKEKYNKPGDVFLGVGHRLDRPVSGVLVFARTSKALGRLHALFKGQLVEKIYWCVSSHLAEATSGSVVQYLHKDEKHNRVTVVDQSKAKTKLAQTRYNLLEQYRDRFLWELRPSTGRSHQLRVAMQTLSMPILGDVKYGGKKIGDASRILLHCRQLSFIHPVKKEPCTITATLPDHPEWQRFK